MKKCMQCPIILKSGNGELLACPKCRNYRLLMIYQFGIVPHGVFSKINVKYCFVDANVTDDYEIELVGDYV